MIIIALFLRLVFSVADPGEGPGGGRLTLFLDQTEAPIASHAGAFRGARISSLPTIRAPLKTPAWEAKAPKAEKNLFGDRDPPPPLSEGLDQPLVL